MTPNSADNERNAELAQIRDEYTRRTSRSEQFDDARRQADYLIWSRTMAEYDRLLAAAGLLPLGERKVLDVGCGRMEFLVRCRENWGQSARQLCGNDLMNDRIERAKIELPYLDLHCGSADELPWPDDTFDLVHQSMLLTSILDADLRRRIVSEMARVTRPGGMVLWYDFVWNPVNRKARGISLPELREYFSGWKLKGRRRITLPPPLSRPLLRKAPWLASALESLRVLNLWELVLLEKPR